MVDQELKKLVLKRVESMPDTIRVSLGGEVDLGRDDLIAHIKKEDELGQLIVEVQIAYLKSFKKEAYGK